MKPISLEIEDINFKGKSMKDVNAHIMFIGLRGRGIRESFKAIDDTNESYNVKSYNRKKFSQILARYERKGTYTRVDFIDGVVKKQLAKKVSESIPDV